jgi:hypothetical protein
MNFLEIALFAAGGLALVLFSIYQGGRKMLKAPEVIPKPELAPLMISSLPPATKAFLESKGFRFSEAYQFHQTRFAIWMQASGGLPLRLFSVMKTNENTTCELMTHFSDEASLTTTRSGSAFVFPRFWGSFLQSFPSATLEKLWESHLQGEESLRKQWAIPVAPCVKPLPEAIREDVVKQMTYVTSLPLWPVQVLYRFAVTRPRMLNRPIWKQDQRSYKKDGSGARS